MSPARTKRNKSEPPESRRLKSIALTVALPAAALLIAAATLIVQLRRDYIDRAELDVRVYRVSVYGDHAEMKGSGSLRYAPWLGTELAISNRGHRPASIRKFGLTTSYVPTGTLAQSADWYTTGTRAGRIASGTQNPITIPPGGFVRTHVTFSLIIGPSGLTSEESAAFKTFVEKVGRLREALGPLAVVVWDGDNNKFVSYEFFAQGGEILVHVPKTHATASATYFPPGEPHSFVLENRDAQRE
jgi:hypothetical protein